MSCFLCKRATVRSPTATASHCLACLLCATSRDCTLCRARAGDKLFRGQLHAVRARSGRMLRGTIGAPQRICRSGLALTPSVRPRIAPRLHDVHINES